MLLLNKRGRFGLPLLFLCIWGLSQHLDAQSLPSKINHNLQELYQGQNAQDPSLYRLINPYEEEKSQVYRFQDQNWVAIEAIPVKACEDLVTELKSLGGIHVAFYGGLVSGLIPVEKIPELEKCTALRFARQSFWKARIGSVTSQGDAAFQADNARTRFQVQGQGSKIGIISDSYNALGGEAAGISSGDLPGLGNPFGNTTPVDVVFDVFTNDRIDEGRAMAELVHDVAPGAELAVASAGFSQANFAQSILSLRDAGSNIIVDDIIFFAEPMFQDGVIAQAVDEVSGDGVHYFSSAGNTGTSSYESQFRDSGVFPVFDAQFGNFMGNYTLHDFDPGSGVDRAQSIIIPGNGSIRFSFQWDEPFASNCLGCPGSASNLDLLISLSPSLNDVFQSFSSTDPNRGLDPVEILTLFNNGPNPVEVFLFIGKRDEGPNNPSPNPGIIKYVNFDDINTNSIEFGNNASTSFGHANAQNASGVGASAFFNTPEFNANLSEAFINNFSSRGGVPILFDVNGNRLASPETRQTPDFVGPDGGNTTFFGNDSGADLDNFPNFFGTSASAPHVAALAALALELDNSLNPDALRQLLANTAQDMDDPLSPGFDTGFDLLTGFGFVQAEEALAAINPPPAPSDLISLEAECATVGANWTFVADANASNGNYVVFEGEDSPNKTNANTGPQETGDDFLLRFDFEVTTAGEYFFFVLSRTPTGNDDSYWVSIDGGPFRLWFQGFVQDDNFNWVPYKAIGDENPLNLGQGAHNIRILYRENGAQLDKIIVSQDNVLPEGLGAEASNICDIVPPTPPNELISLEAECATLGSNWTVREDSRAAGGKFVVFLGNDDLNRKNASEGPADLSPESRVTFSFDLAAAGVFDLFALVNTPTNNDDSFWISIDGGPFLLWFQGFIQEDAFNWVALQAIGQSNPLTLGAGTHRIDFLYRENGAILDKLILRQDGNIPQGLGEDAQNACSIAGPQLISLEAECASVGSNWTTLSSNEASNGSFVTYLADDTPNRTSASQGPGDTTAASQVRFNFNLDQAGSFDLFVLARTPDNNADSFWISIDGGPYRLWFEGFVDEPDFKWVAYKAIGDENPINLASGPHIIDILYRENGAELDKLILREDGLVPSGFGEVAQVLCTPEFVSSSVLPMQVYPNPLFQDELSLSFSEAVQGDLLVEIMDLQKGWVRHIPMYLHTSQNELSLDLSEWNLPRGAYAIRVSSAQKTSDVLRVWKAE